MIVELNKVYLISAPVQAKSMTDGNDAFLRFDSETMNFVKDGEVSAASTENKVYGMSKMFTANGRLMQAIIFYDSNNQKEVVRVQKVIRSTIQKYTKPAQGNQGPFKES